MPALLKLMHHAPLLLCSLLYQCKLFTFTFKVLQIVYVDEDVHEGVLLKPTSIGGHLARRCKHRFTSTTAPTPGLITLTSYARLPSPSSCLRHHLHRHGGQGRRYASPSSTPQLQPPPAVPRPPPRQPRRGPDHPRRSLQTDRLADR